MRAIGLYAVTLGPVRDCVVKQIRLPTIFSRCLHESGDKHLSAHRAEVGYTRNRSERLLNLARSAGAIDVRGNTSSAAPCNIASRGMPNTMQLASS